MFVYKNYWQISTRSDTNPNPFIFVNVPNVNRVTEHESLIHILPSKKQLERNIRSLTTILAKRSIF
jgi:hypothetical protein